MPLTRLGLTFGISNFKFQTNSSFLFRLPLGAALAVFGTQNASFYHGLLIRLPC